MPFDIFSGVICGPSWGSFVVLGSFAVGDHLWSRDYLGRCTILSEESELNVSFICFRFAGISTAGNLHEYLHQWNTGFHGQFDSLEFTGIFTALKKFLQMLQLDYNSTFTST